MGHIAHLKNSSNQFAESKNYAIIFRERRKKYYVLYKNGIVDHLLKQKLSPFHTKKYRAKFGKSW